MSTTNVKSKKKIPKHLSHKSKKLPKAPKKSLPKTPNKNKPKEPRSISFKRSDQTQPLAKPTYPSQTRNNRAQTFSYNTTTDQSKDGTTMTYTYTTTYQFATPSTQSNHTNHTNHSNPSKPPQETIITYNNFKRSNSTKSQPETVIMFSNNNNNGNINGTTGTTFIITQPTNSTTTTRSRAQSSHKPQSSYHQILPLAPTIRNSNMEYCYLDNVILNDNRQGTIKYIGEIDINLKGEIWYGIELSDARGQNNGSLRGQKYFNCGDKYGTFVQKKNIRWLAIGDNEHENEIDLDSMDRFHINQIIRLKNKKGKAQIRCICENEIDKKLKFGIELLNDMGNHSGIVNGKFYFTCGFYKGLFVGKSDLISLKNGDPIGDEQKKHTKQLSVINVNKINLNSDGIDDDEHDEYDSDQSDESVSMDNSNFLNEIQLNEEDENMLFSNILNKLKADGRNAQQTDSESEEFEEDMDENTEDIKTEEYDDYDDENDDQTHLSPIVSVPKISTHHSADSNHSLMASETSPATTVLAGATTSPVTFKDIDNNKAGKSKKLSIIMSNYDENKLINEIFPTNNNNNISIVNSLSIVKDNAPTIEPVAHALKLPSIHTSPMASLSTPPMDNNYRNSILSPMLSPLQTPTLNNKKMGLQTPLSVDKLNEDFSKYTKDNCHLKEYPDSPFDVNTTRREFSNCALTIQLGCNNPHKLFKILHAMVGKLYLNTIKYRSLNLLSHKIRIKLLNNDGVEEFFNLLGFEKHENKLECDLYQPPLSVLKDAINILTKFISKTGRKRAVVDMLKKFQVINFDELKDDIIDADLARDTPNKIQTPVAGINSFSAMVEKQNDIEIAKNEIQKIETVINDVFTPEPESEPDDVETPQPEPNDAVDIVEEEEDDDDSHFQLYDIINSITHPDNNDSSAILMILLCYPLFSESIELFQCLKKRFLKCNDNTEFIIQKKVIGFIDEWMLKYWEEDWILNNKLKQMFNEFVDIIIDIKTNDKYQEMVDYLLDIQNDKLTQKNNNININILNKKYGFDRMISNKKCNNFYEFNNIKFDTFFRLNNNIISKQITIIDFEFFSKIKSRECVGQSWKKKNKYKIAENICNCIDHFNRITIWVQTRILLCDTIKKRSKIIKKFIKICEILFSMRNFQSLYSVYAGLNSSPIIRLKKSWHSVATKHLAKFEEFKVIFSSKKNMANLRKLHRETYPPMIPYLGIYLQDLFQIEEGNQTVSDSGSVNFNILIRLTNVIDQLLNLQKHHFNLKKNQNIMKILCHEFKLNQNLNENSIWKLSDKAKKNDEKKRLFG